MTESHHSPQERKPMACPVCTKTMVPLGCCLVTGFPVHYCVVCGSVKPCDQPADDLVVPDLVHRCREFEKKLIEWQGRHSPADLLVKTSDLIDLWHRLGIPEAIHTPSERSL